MTASVTHGRALRYAKGSARGLLIHHPVGHYRVDWINSDIMQDLRQNSGDVVDDLSS